MARLVGRAPRREVEPIARRARERRFHVDGGRDRLGPELTDRDVVRLDNGREILTLAFSNPTPWHTHRELPEDAIARWVNEQAAMLEHPESAIFNFHVPPFNTPLDLAPRLDQNLTKLMSPGGEPQMIHVGSTAVRAALERYHPLLGLHGHIHESRGTVTFGRTLSINCGSAYTEGALLGAVVDIDGDQVKAVLTSG
jgi:Icc-related predicted phosphoesterase